MEKLIKRLPPGIGFDWTGLSFEERRAGSQTGALYAISLVVVFLCLAALYESWTIPAAVIMVVPLGVFGAIMATLLRGLNDDVFFQVGLLTTIGLSAKNAILIVEFAKANYEQGMELSEATLRAAHQRLRPILMTSLAFVLGVTPLAIATGAGSGAKTPSAPASSAACWRRRSWPFSSCPCFSWPCCAFSRSSGARWAKYRGRRPRKRRSPWPRGKEKGGPCGPPFSFVRGGET